MSIAAAFDTHSFIKQLIATGFTEEQAETQVRLLSEILDTQLSTKADVAKVDANVLELKRDIKELDGKTETRFKELDIKLETKFKEVDSKFKELELRMVIKLGALTLAGIGLLFGLMRAWPLPVQYVPTPGQEMRYAAPPVPQPIIPQSAPAPAVTAPAPSPTVTAPVSPTTPTAKPGR